MTTQETPQDRFKAARSKFLNGRIDTNSPEVGKSTSTPKKFKYEVKTSGKIWTTRLNNTGGGLKEMPQNAKTNYSSSIQKTDSTSSLSSTSSIEDTSLDTSAHNVESRKKVTFASPVEKEMKQQLPETQRIIDTAKQ